MAEKENWKKTWEIETFQTVVCREKKLTPFLNVFNFEGITPQQKKMGRLFGAIQVFDYQEKSAYLPNLVAQVIKKEFFKEEKRTSEESFEMALRKANLALTDLASHEIIGWLGKFHAVIGAIQENNFWFTQSGGGKIILVRKKIANEISAGLNNEENTTHPIKTFSNISSGTLEEEDKIIFATEGVFEKNRWEEFSRHITVFSSSELDNLLRSTIELEAENAGFVLINMHLNETVELIKEINTNKDQVANLNFFGNQEKTPEIKLSETEIPRKETFSEKTKNDIETSPFEKEPELYIKENEPEKIIEENTLKEENFFDSTLKKITNWQEKLFFWKHPKIKNSLAQLQYFSQNSLKKMDCIKPNLNFSSSRKKISSFFQKTEKEISDENSPTGSNASSFSFIRNIFNKRNQFIILFLLLILIVWFFLFFVFKKEKPTLSEETISDNVNSEQKNNSSSQINSTTLKELIDLPEKVQFSTFLKKQLYFVSENNTFYQVDISNQEKPNLKKIDLPSEVSAIKNIVSMNDLNLVFLITEKEIFSYSPVTEKILSNEISNLPTNKTASFSYLTYLYLLDSSANQIVQYPRAGTGFGTQKNWLKEPADLNQAIDFSADDSIFVLFSDGKIVKYFRGKKITEFYLTKNNQKIISKKIQTSLDSEWLFLLSPEQKTVFKTDKNGQIIQEWTSEQLGNSQKMEVDFKNKTIFVFTENQKILEIKY